ncbi:MAG: AlbA family DNA-binding domain-containing protein [Gammaproteobacteria bacterium]
MLHIRFDQIDEHHLRRVIEIGATESRAIEYKCQTYGKNDDAKAEFLADVSSFANTVGGDLIIGMSATKGVPIAFEPFTGDHDAEILRLESMARGSLQPRIANLQPKVVPLSEGGVALVFRVPRSYNPPHRITFKGKNRFWARSSAGKYEPDVDELRAIFILAPPFGGTHYMTMGSGTVFGDPMTIIERDQLHFTEVICEEVLTDDQSCASVMRPILDQLANAAGHASTPHFDAGGRYLLQI